MHDGLVFPIECRYEQVVWEKYITRQGVMSCASDSHSRYDAMDDLGLIPSLVALVGDGDAPIRQREGGIKKWIRQYGFLTSPNQPGVEGYDWHEENLEKFWNKAKRLVNLWDIYRMITNRELEELKEIISFHDTRVLDINGKLVPFGPGITQGSVYPHETVAQDRVFTTSEHTLFFNKELGEINKEPLRYYQRVAFSYIRTEVQRELKVISLVSKDMQLESSSEQDYFKTFPILEPATLLQALYLQFYIIMSTPGKKICQECGNVFLPSRKDRKYCNETCKNTAKSRRYRARRKARSKIKGGK